MVFSVQLLLIRIEPMKRRQFLAVSTIFSTFLLIKPVKLLAEWSAKNFQQCSIDQAFMNALGTREIVTSDTITIRVPSVATDSSTVPVEVYSSLKGDQLYLFVEKNFVPLVFKCSLQGNAIPWFSLNIKMKESSALYAVVREGGKFFMASVHVEISSQAC